METVLKYLPVIVFYIKCFVSYFTFARTNAKSNEYLTRWSLILRLPKEVIDFCDKFNTGQGNMYDTPIDFRKFSSGYLDGKCFGEQKRLQPARHASTI